MKTTVLLSIIAGVGLPITLLVFGYDGLIQFISNTLGLVPDWLLDMHRGWLALAIAVSALLIRNNFTKKG